jgi:hypothetical protein
MAATAGQVADLRRMVGEPNDTTYDDELLTDIIERYPLIDSDGYEPDHDDWTSTYDLNAAAADIWSEKAAVLAPNYDFAADGGRYSRSQGHQHAMQMARYYRARRSPGTVTLRMEPRITEVEDGTS